MTRFTRYTAALLLAFFALATVHCELEKVPGLSFLAWCHSEDAAAHQDNGCEGDACSVVESGFYRIEEQPAAVTAPVLALSHFLPLLQATRPTAELVPELPNSSPPEVQRLWQFSFRAALPPRAPSLLA